MEQIAKVGPTVISILIPSHVTDMLSTIYSRLDTRVERTKNTPRNSSRMTALHIYLFRQSISDELSRVRDIFRKERVVRTVRTMTSLFDHCFRWVPTAYLRRRPTPRNHI